MAVCSIVKIGNPVLRIKTRRLLRHEMKTPRFKTLVTNMIQTMRHARGVGLAANQVGQNLRIAVLECRSNPRYPGAHGFGLQVWMNPQIIQYSREKEAGWEGCLSIPGYRGSVLRSRWVVLEALDLNGNKFRGKIHGFHARVIQHEIDHLHGLFYMDRMRGLKTWMHVDELSGLMGVRVKDR